VSPPVAPPAVGALVVVDGEPGVLRVERVLQDGRLRCLRYVDGGFVVVDAALVHPCPPGTRAAP
jgi:hypothetical protein